MRKRHKIKTVHRNLVGTLEVPDWEAYAAELQQKSAHDKSARELLAGLCEQFPKLREKFGSAAPDALQKAA